MKAVIMAGGEGTRLRPVTCTMPKPLVPLLNKPIIDYTMELLKKHGIDRAVCTVRYMADDIKNYVGNGVRWNIDCDFVEEDKPLGTAGGVALAVNAEDEEILVMSGDGITDLNISKLIAEHRKSHADATIVLKKVKCPTEYGIAVLNDDNTINSFIEKPELSEVFSDLANTGIYVIAKKAFELIPPNTEYDFSKQLFPKMLSLGMKICGYVTNDYWCDIGNISEYRRAQRDMLDGKVKFDSFARNYSGIYVEANAEIANNAVFIPPCYIGGNSIIEDNAVIGPYAVIGSNVIAKGGCNVKNSIVFQNVLLGVKTQLRGAVVCEKALLRDKTQVFENSIVGAGSVVGESTSIMNGISVWPDKKLDEGLKYNQNIIWGSPNYSVSFRNGAVEGYFDKELTPETVLRLAAAFTSSIKDAKTILVSCDDEPVSALSASAATVGVTAHGVNVICAKPLSRAAFTYAVQNKKTDGGIYILADSKYHGRFIMVDSTGTELDNSKLRSLRFNFLTGEQKPMQQNKIGEIEDVEQINHDFLNNLSKLINVEQIKKSKINLMLNCNATEFNNISSILNPLGQKVEKSNLLVPHDENTISIAFNSNDKPAVAFLSNPNGVSDYSTVFTLIAADGIERSHLRSITIPITVAEEHKHYLESLGVKINCDCEDNFKLKKSAYKNNDYYAPLYEVEAMTLKLTELFSIGRLQELVRKIPHVFVIEKQINATKNDIGYLLRKLAESEKTSDMQMLDGLKIKTERGWVIVKPLVGSRTSLRIIAGSAVSEFAEEISIEFVDKLEKLKSKS